MKNNIPKISIPHPCTQVWGDMQPIPNGRFCGSCQKTVIDFFGMSNTEILDILSSSSQICGRFTDFQLLSLNNSVIPPKRSFSLKWLSVAAAVISFLSLIKAEAKGVIPKIIHQQSVSLVGKSLSINRDTIYKTLTGKIVDAHNEPLPGVTVKVKDTKLRTTTATNGEFVINVPEVKRITLIVSFIGYKTMEVKVRPGNKGKLNLKLEMQSRILGEVAIVD